MENDQPEECLDGFEVINWGAGPYLYETWRVMPESGPGYGSAHWPKERRERQFETMEELQARVAELTAELDWVAIA